MFGWFKKKKTLEQRIEEIKQFAKDEQLTAHNVNLLYFKLAIERNWRDAADHFLSIHFIDELRMRL